MSWGWSFKGVCQDTRKPIEVYALLGEPGDLSGQLESLFKLGNNPMIHSRPLKDVLRAALADALSGILWQVDYITLYPGHTGKINPALQSIAGRLAGQVSPLLIRHTHAPRSRYQHASRAIHHQFNTLHVNPTVYLKGRCVLVLDDFTTTGYSLEAARRMLLQAGADRVVAVAMARFNVTYHTTRISKAWNACEPTHFAPGDIRVIAHTGVFNPLADVAFVRRI